MFLVVLYVCIMQVFKFLDNDLMDLNETVTQQFYYTREGYSCVFLKSFTRIRQIFEYMIMFYVSNVSNYQYITFINMREFACEK